MVNVTGYFTIWTKHLTEHFVGLCVLFNHEKCTVQSWETFQNTPVNDVIVSRHRRTRPGLFIVNPFFGPLTSPAFSRLSWSSHSSLAACCILLLAPRPLWFSTLDIPGVSRDVWDLIHNWPFGMSGADETFDVTKCCLRCHFSRHATLLVRLYMT